MKKLFENWRKHIDENEYEPGRAVDDVDTGEERLSPEEMMQADVATLSRAFQVEASIETASDGRPAILVWHQGDEVSAYHDADEMYQDLASRQEANIGDL